MKESITYDIFKVMVKDENTELGRFVESKPYGSLISGSDKGSSTDADAYYKGYYYESCTTATVVSAGTTVYRYFVFINIPDEPETANYKVMHQQKQLDGTYKTVDMKTLNAEIGSEVTPPVNTYENYTSPEPQTITVVADGSTIVIYQYRLKTYKVTYVDIAKDTNKELGKVTENVKYGTSVSGSDKGDNKTVGVYYKDYKYDSCTSAIVGSSGTVVYRYFVLDKDDEPKKVDYKVIHEEEQPDGSYKIVETEILEGELGEEVTPEPKEKGDFEKPVPQTVIIKEDGSTEVIYKYERKKAVVTYIDMDKDSKKELGKTTEKVKVGATVSGADRGTDKTADAYYKDYLYDSCTTAIVEKSGTTVYRYFVAKKADEPEKPDEPDKPKDADYKIIYQEEQPDGTYKTVETETHKGTVGDKVTPEPKPKDGFETPEKQTVEITEDGKAVIIYKYARKSYPVTYIDMVKGTKTELGRETVEKKFELTVSGSDMGSSIKLGEYYKDYIYDSCTTATVTTSGATVYRYFVADKKLKLQKKLIIQ